MSKMRLDHSCFTRLVPPLKTLLTFAILSLGIAIAVGVCSPISAAQDSYQAQKIRRMGPAVGQTTQTTPSLGTKTLIHSRRFLGWKAAQKQALTDGPAALQHFLALRTHKDGAMRAPSEDVFATSAEKTSAGGPGKSLVAQTTPNTSSLPGLVGRPSLLAGAIPTAVVTGDFNGDGKIDWVVANGADDTLFVYLGNGDGTAQLPVMIPLSGQSPIALAVADFNGDGKLDLAVVQADSQNVGILLGNGNGTFGIQTNLPALPLPVYSIAVGDVNKDGKTDLVVGVQPNPGPFVVYLGDGTGKFGGAIEGPPSTSAPSELPGYSVSVADVNGDGAADILFTGDSNIEGDAEVFLSQGNGSFSAGVVVYLSGVSQVTSGVLVDVNGDGCPDAVIGDVNATVHIFTGNCQGQFDTSSTLGQFYGMGDPATSLAVADVNGDGKPDLVIGGAPFEPLSLPIAGNLVGIRLNDGTGHFGPLAVYAGDPGMYSLAVADLKGNGFPEVITANEDGDSVTVFQNNGAGGFGDPQGGYLGPLNGNGNWPSAVGATDFLIGDVDGNGLPDIVQIQFPIYNTPNPYTLAVSLNQGSEKFQAPVSTNLFDAATQIGDLVLADFRKTAKLDFLVEATNYANSAVTGFGYAEYTGNGGYSALTYIPFPTLATGDVLAGIGVGDFNHDGKLDFVSVIQSGANNDSFQVLMNLGNGNGTFQSTTQSLTGPVSTATDISPKSPAPIFVEDANGDGKLDFLVWFPYAGELLEFLGNGDGTFQAPKLLLQNVSAMTVGDLNNDGLLDVVQISGDPTSITLPATFTVYLGRADGTLANPNTYTPFKGQQRESGGALYRPSSALYSQILGDFNNDGILDIAVFEGPYYSSLSYLQFMLGHGDGTFTPDQDVFVPGEWGVPITSVRNLTGDGTTPFLYENQWGAGYVIMPTAKAPTFQVSMDEKPALISTDALHIALNTLATSSTVFQITASDPGIQIAASATIPAGTSTLDVPFTIGNSFNKLKAFSITAQTGAESYTAYNYVIPPGISPAQQAAILGPIPDLGPIEPGSSTGTFQVYMVLQGDDTGTFHVVGCLDLPASASCNFAGTTTELSPWTNPVIAFTISTTSAIAPAIYPFRVQLTDGVQNFYAAAQFAVGDFTVSLSPATASTTGTTSFTYTIGAVDYFIQPVNLTCSGLPPGAICAIQFGIPGTSGELDIQWSPLAPPGNYTFTLSGTVGSDTHSASATLKIPPVSVASISPNQVAPNALLAGSSPVSNPVTLQNTGNTAMTIQGIVVNGGTASVGTFTETNNCGNSVAAGASCTINVTFTPTAAGITNSTLQITDNALSSPQTVSLYGSVADYSLMTAGGVPPSETVTAGQMTNYNLDAQITQVQGTLQLTCTGAPAGTTCSVPATLAANGTGTVPFNAVVATTARKGAMAWRWPRQNLRSSWKLSIAPVLFALLLLAMAKALFGSRARMARMGGVVTLLFVLAFLAACGGGGSSGGGGGSGGGGTVLGTQAGTYTLVVTASYGGSARTLNLQLIVQ